MMIPKFVFNIAPQCKEGTYKNMFVVPSQKNALNNLKFKQI